MLSSLALKISHCQPLAGWLQTGSVHALTLMDTRSLKARREKAISTTPGDDPSLPSPAPGGSQHSSTCSYVTALCLYLHMAHVSVSLMKIPSTWFTAHSKFSNSLISRSLGSFTCKDQISNEGHILGLQVDIQPATPLM